jgi:transposase
MYIRTKTTPRSKNVSVQLVESFRSEGKSKQRVVRHLGTAPMGQPLEKLKRLAEAVMVELEHNALRQKNKTAVHPRRSPLGVLSAVSEDVYLHGASLQESQRYVIGIHDIYGYVYDQIGFQNPFSRPHQRENSAKILREIVLARIAKPQSKRASVEHLQNQFGVSLNLDHVYQMMDKIDDIFCERIQKKALKTVLQLTGEKLKVLFYDATTLYFESFTEDELKQNGYSKDMKFNQPQVILTLFVTEKGLPVGYQLFPGSTFEGRTLVTVLDKLKTRYQVDNLVVVADRGMLSDENLHYLEENNYRYIVGAKLRSLNQVRQEKIFAWSDKIEKEKITEEITHRILFEETKKNSIKIIEENLSEEICGKFKKFTYVLNKKEKKWFLSNYKEGKYLHDIPIEKVPSLDDILQPLSETSQKLSADDNKKIKEIINNYHNKQKLLILSYRTGRAKKDQADREASIQRLHARLKRSNNPKQLISNYGFQKFIQVEGEAALQIDNEKLKEEARWDGIKGVFTNDSNLSNEEVLSHYRGLWQVEESFRINKHDLRIRPIYHWTPHRIKAHIAIAFMTFVCVRYLEYRVAVQSQKLSPQVIRNALMDVQASFIKDTATGKTYLLPSKIGTEAKEIYRVIGQPYKQSLMEVEM